MNRRTTAFLLRLAGRARVDAPYGVPAVALAEPAGVATVEGYTQSPVVNGNRAELLLNGDRIFPDAPGDPRSGADDHVRPVLLRRRTPGRRPRRRPPTATAWACGATCCSTAWGRSICPAGTSSAWSGQDHRHRRSPRVHRQREPGQPLVRAQRGAKPRRRRGRLDPVFADDLRNARRVTSEDWEARGLSTRALEPVATPIRRLL